MKILKYIRNTHIMEFQHNLLKTAHLKASKNDKDY